MNDKESFFNMVLRAQVFDPLIFCLPLLAVHHLFWWLSIYLFLLSPPLLFLSFSFFLLFSWLTPQNSPLKTLFLLNIQQEGPPYFLPCSYPTQAGWHSLSWAQLSHSFPTLQRPTHQRPKSDSGFGIRSPRPKQGFCSDSSSSMGNFPTNIDQAMHSLSLSSPDEQYYMDTGATSHMTRS